MIEVGNKVYRSGHPDWNLDHKKRESPRIVSVDPGYGTSSGRELPQVNLYIGNFLAYDCARKGIDAHTGTDTTIENFKVKSGYYGISIAIEERFSDPREDSSTGHQINRYIVRNGDIECSNYGVHVINGAMSERNDGQPWDLRTAFYMDGLNIKAPRPYFNNFGRGGFTLTNSVLAFGAPYPLQTGVTNYEALYLGSENTAENNRGTPIDATLENIQIMNTSKGNFYTGLAILPLRKLHISNVTIHTQAYTTNANARAAWAGEATMVRSGQPTTALAVRTKPTVVSGGGVTEFVASQQIHRVLDGELGLGTTSGSSTTGSTTSTPTVNTEGKFSTGILKFNAGTATEAGVTSNDKTAVIVPEGNYPPAGYTLLKVDGATSSTTTGGNSGDTGSSAPSSPPVVVPGKYSTGILKFNTGAVTENQVSSNDGVVVITAEGNYPPANYTLVATDGAAASSSSGTSGTGSSENTATTSPTQAPPVSPPGKFATGILKFDTGTATADQVSSNDNTAVINAEGNYPPAGYTLTKEV